MGKTYPGGVQIITPFTVQSDGPIADYMVVDSIGDLAGLREFAGMLVYVVSIKKYYYYSGTGWEEWESGTGSGSSDYFGISDSDGTISYDANDNISTITYTNGIILSFNYTNENLTSISSNDGKVKTLVYDADNNLIEFLYS